MKLDKFLKPSNASYDRYFTHTIARSYIFVLITLFVFLALAREILIAIAYWPVVSNGVKTLFVILIALTPLPWIRLISHHSQIRRSTSIKWDLPLEKRSLRAQIARDMLGIVMLTYILLNISLSLPELLRFIVDGGS
jgi:hypothetical protein